MCGRIWSDSGGGKARRQGQELCLVFVPVDIVDCASLCVCVCVCDCVEAFFFQLIFSIEKLVAIVFDSATAFL